MANTNIQFKGMTETIPAIIVYSGKEEIASVDDRVTKATRPVLEINFPETVEYDTLMKAYRDENALSEISIIQEGGSTFVHMDYMIRVSLALVAYENEADAKLYGANRWIMKLAQLTETDKQLRETVAKVTNSVAYMTLDEYKQSKIQQSKTDLETYLTNTPLISACKDGIYAPYTATTEKQQLFVSQYASYSANKAAGIEDQMTWNERGKSCVPWTDLECLTFMNDMKKYTKPLVSAQQHFEENVLKLTSKADVESASLDYSTVETVNGKEWWIGHTVEEVAALIEAYGNTDTEPEDVNGVLSK